MSIFGRILAEVVGSAVEVVQLGASIAVDVAALPLAVIDPDLVGEPFERTENKIEELKS